MTISQKIQRHKQSDHLIGSEQRTFKVIAPPEDDQQAPTVIIHTDQCKACGLCIANCPKDVLQRGETINVLGYQATEYQGEGCVGCGTCFYTCPEPGAITVIKKPVRPRESVAHESEHESKPGPSGASIRIDQPHQ